MYHGTGGGGDSSVEDSVEELFAGIHVPAVSIQALKKALNEYYLLKAYHLVEPHKYPLFYTP
ncbi:hypothetical protein B6F84_10455 [Acidianus manzaensis]|uniref:Uncharacterized protein n=1 Tax=Acidianus manzaensis TaxID=282676 RepID=A0A1W6K1I8_9CREN|nr:hypothetical protein B6F84_10455 [Acidianus manzaensis]